MKVLVVSMSAILMSIALASAATAGPAGGQGKEKDPPVAAGKDQSVVGTITAISAKEQTITVTPFSAEQLQNQQGLPSQSGKDAAPTSYVFRIDQSTEILGGGVAKKGKPAVVVKKKGVTQDDGQAAPPADQKDQNQGASGTQAGEQAQGVQAGPIQAFPGKVKKGKTEEPCGKLDLLQVGQVVDVAYTAVEVDTSAQQADQAQASAAQVLVKTKLGKGPTDSPATLLAKRIRVMNTVSPSLPGVEVVPPAAPQPPAPPVAPAPPGAN